MQYHLEHWLIFTTTRQSQWHFTILHDYPLDTDPSADECVARGGFLCWYGDEMSAQGACIVIEDVFGR
jgi:hypothetical protein